MSIIVLSNHTNVGVYSTRYNIINCHARVSHKHRIHGKPGLQLCLQKNQNAPRPSAFVTLHLGLDGCH